MEDGLWRGEERAPDQLIDVFVMLDDSARDVIEEAIAGWEERCRAEGDWSPPPNYYAAFQTRPDFGCVLWEAKDTGE